MFEHVNRWQAFFVHLTASILVFSCLLGLMFFVWYASPFFLAEGGLDILAVVGGVDVVLGPLLTLIVFKPGKPSLKFDLSVIVLIQLSALLYGGHLIYKERPLYAVFVPDEFIIVSNAQLEMSTDLEARPGFFSRPKYVVSMYSHDPELWKKYPHGFLNALDQAANGPQFFAPYSEHHELAVPSGQPLLRLIKHSDDYAERVDRFLRSRRLLQEDVFYIPLMGRKRVMALVIEKANGDIHGAINVDPNLAAPLKSGDTGDSG